VESTVNVGSTFSIHIPTEPTPGKPPTGELNPDVVPEAPKEQTGETGRLDPNKLPPQVLAAMGGGEAASEAAPAPAPPVGGAASQDTAKQFVPVRRRAPVHIKRQVLLVEDNLDLVDQLRRTLQREGFEVFTVSTAMEAEAMASGLRPTLIVVDADFANGGGWALLERFGMREDTSDTPVIVLALADQTRQAEQLGAFSFIRKPFMPETLADAARAAEQAARINRILIIDDDDKSVRLLKDLLGESGSYRIYHAANGVEGVSMVARRRPNLVICDLRMPEMDGFKVIQELRGNPETADIPIMVVTGDTLNQHEIIQLSEMKVIYKPDIDLEGSRVFLDNVKDHLSKQNGDG
jgi:CheY-like chemotaxis protein